MSMSDNYDNFLSGRFFTSRISAEKYEYRGGSS